jgi:ribose 5-phosphate isomerase A
MVVGLGSGHAAATFLRVLAGRVTRGLRVHGVPTSRRTTELATATGVTVTSFEAVGKVDVMIDGADEVDPRLDLIKGYGGALVREKIVAESSARHSIVVDDSKLVPRLGSRGRPPVEVVPFGVPLCQRRSTELCCPPTIRATAAGYFVTDNGSYILDCAVSDIPDPTLLDERIRAIPGVVTSGLFNTLDLAAALKGTGVTANAVHPATLNEYEDGCRSRTPVTQLG